MADRLENLKNSYTGANVLLGNDVDWLIAEIERLRYARIADLNELAEGFELTGRTSVDGAVFRACAHTVQDKITEIELGATDE
jgi:hypothetical protein